MLGRSQNLRSLFRLHRRGLSSATAPPPKNPEGSGAAEGGSLKYLAGGLVVALTGAAVYFNRDLFHDVPIHPVIFKPSETLQTLPAHQELSSDPPKPEATVFKAEAATVEETPKSAMPVEEPSHETEVHEKEKTEPEAQEKSVAEPDVIPPEIIDNTAMVELFSEALGEKLAAEGKTPSTPTEPPAGVQEWLNGDLDASALSRKLLAAAVKDAVETQPDWAEFQARHKQATYDASMFKCFIDKERSLSKAAVNELQEKINQDENQIKQLEESMSAMKIETEEKVQEVIKKSEKKHKRQMKLLREKVEFEAAQNALEERVQRLKTIDEMRQRMNVLTSAVTNWTDQTKSFTRAQQTSLEAASLNKILDRHESGIAWLSSLKAEEIKDPMLKAALSCLPREKVPSKRELVKSLGHLRHSLEPLAMLPPNGGGLLSQLAANIGARIKIKVPEIYGDASDITSQLDQVERAVIDGNVSKAITLLTEITDASAAEHLTKDWLHSARQYATLTQVQKILLARAQELTSTISCD